MIKKRGSSRKLLPGKDFNNHTMEEQERNSNGKIPADRDSGRRKYGVKMYGMDNRNPCVCFQRIGNSVSCLCLGPLKS